MTLFQRFSSLFGRTPAALTNFLTGWAEGSPGTLDDPYGLSPWVSRAIRHISQPLAGVPVKFQRDGMDYDDNVLSDFWKSPAKGKARMGRGAKMSRFDAIEATVGWLCLRGEFFWLLDETWKVTRAAKSPFIIARPDRMTPIVDDGDLIGWTYQDAGRRMWTLLPEDVVTSSFWNPEDDFRGAAPARAAMLAAEADYASARFWKNLAESNGDLGETVIAPNGVTPEQQEQIKIMLRRKREAAKRGKYLPSFFVGDVRTEEARIQSPDASAVTQRLQNRHEVFIALGVPPSFAEVTASYSVGSASDRYKLIEETCMPMGQKIAEAMETVSQRLTGVAVDVAFSFDAHSTMQQVRKERYESAKSLHERGMPWSVINDVLDLGLSEFPGWDRPFLPFAVQEWTAAAPVVVTGEKRAGDAFAELEELIRGCPAHPTRMGGDGAAKRAPAGEKWTRLMERRAPFVKRARTLVERALFEARRETLANIAEAQKSVEIGRAGAFDFLFDLARFLEMLIQPLFRYSFEAYEAAGGQMLADEMGISDPFISADPNGLAWLANRKNFIKDAGTEVWEEIRDALDEGLVAGESFDKLAGRVREKFNDASKTRAMTIAITETSIAFESGRHDAMIQAGAEWKEWLTSEDDRVRDTHVRLAGKRVRMEEPFMVGPFPMMYPCDPNGPPQEIIRCRCVHGPSEAPPEESSDIEGNNPSTPIPF